MPFYEYECSDCGQYVEALQKISDPPLRECPGCKHESLTRLMSAPAFRLKGAGWYETDFKSGDSKRNLAESGSGSSEGSTSSSDSSSKESPKPAEAKESKSEAKKESTSESKPAAKPAETKSTTAV